MKYRAIMRYRANMKYQATTRYRGVSYTGQPQNTDHKAVLSAIHLMPEGCVNNETALIVEVVYPKASFVIYTSVLSKYFEDIS